MKSKGIFLLFSLLLAATQPAQAAINFSTDTANDLAGTFSVTGTAVESAVPSNFNFGLSFCMPVRVSRSTTATVGLQCAGSPDDPGFTLQGVSTTGPQAAGAISGMTNSLAGTGVPTFYFLFSDLQDTGGTGGTFSGKFCFSRSATGCGSSVTTATLTGFDAPVESPAVATNLAKAGKTIPLRFFAATATGPIMGLQSVRVAITGVDCANVPAALDALEEYVPGKAVGLQELGGGYYQYNWSTRLDDLGSCKSVTLALPAPYVTETSPVANFKFAHK